MTVFEKIKSFKIKELSKELWRLTREIPPYYTEKLNEISKVYELQNQVVALSNRRVANALMDTISHIAYAKAESNYDTYCIYLKKAIKDLMSGMDAIEMLKKYDEVLYYLENPKTKYRGYRAEIIVVDDLCGIDKDTLNELIEEYAEKHDLKT